MSGIAPVQPVNSVVSAYASNYNWALSSASLPPAFTHSAILIGAHCFAVLLKLTFDSDVLPVCQRDCCALLDMMVRKILCVIVCVRPFLSV